VKINLVPSDKFRGKTRFLLCPCDDSRGGLPGGLAVPESVGQAIVVAPPRKGGQTRVVVSVGKKEDLTAEIVRRAAAAAAKWMRSNSVSAAGLEPVRWPDAKEPDCVRAVAEGLVLGSFEFNRHKSDRKAAARPSVEILVRRSSAGSSRALRDAQRICAGTILARELGHEPPNVINPVSLAAKARTLARKCGLKCSVLDDKQLTKQKMNAMVAVGKASATPARLIVLEYPGRGARPGQSVVLIGKAITFDTGGYSLKPNNSMVGMKYDKCGGTTVIGIMHAIAACKPRVPVVGIIAAAENMIAGDAYRPNDIIKTMDGKTVEIISADAEGRMVLCDALTYAQKKYKPRCLIDLATLTGGVVLALGRAAAGIFTNDDSLQEALIESGRRVHERLWPLPVWDEYLELIRGDDSDLKNSGGREAHASVGAIFLKQFVDEKVPWAHLDIAGVANVDKDLPYCPKGATGFGVRLLLDYLMKLSSK